jgi:hypothetical protein
MYPSAVRWSALVLACLLAVGCKDRHEPVKPTVSPDRIAAIA